MGNYILNNTRRSNNNQSNKIPKRQKKKPVKPLLQPLSVEEVIKAWEEYRKISKKVSNVFATLYFTGARVSEVINLRRKDITFLEKDGVKVIVFNMLTLKNRRHKFRKLPIFVKPPYDKMAGELAEWIQYYNSYERLFPRTRVSINQWLKGKDMRRLRQIRRVSLPLIHTKAYYYDSKKELDITRPFYPHFLRHCRLSHLSEHHHFDALKLMYWAGWTDPKLANIYVRMDWRALAKAIQDYSDW